LCSSKLHISIVGFVGIAQVPQLAMIFVEHDARPIDLHPSFDERYQDREFFHHVSEVTPLQLDALE
jgi:hypothetical protein